MRNEWIGGWVLIPAVLIVVGAVLIPVALGLAFRVFCWAAGIRLPAGRDESFDIEKG